MDILGLLRQDHQEIDLYLAALEDTTAEPIETRKRLFDLLLVALKTHERVEEEVVYPRLLDESLGIRPRILGSFEEHAVIDGLLRDLGKLPMNEESWLPTLAVLGRVLKLHIDAEEKLFDTIREHVEPEELSALAARFQSRKDAMTGPRVVRPLRPHGAHPRPMMGKKASSPE